jgi:hypothetical protein
MGLASDSGGLPVVGAGSPAAGFCASAASVARTQNAAASAKDLTLINESPLASLSSAPTPHESRKPEYMLTYNNYI